MILNKDFNLKKKFNKNFKEDLKNILFSPDFKEFVFHFKLIIFLMTWLLYLAVLNCIIRSSLLNYM